ncbi:MAG: nucleotidyltransferase domain-containing protein [Candidatus Brocadiia bacterium]
MIVQSSQVKLMCGYYAKEAVLKRRSQRQDELQRELERIKNVLSAQPDVERIIIFGSFARGESGERSDLDILVIQQTDKRFLERVDELYQLILPRLDVDLLVYTPEEWECIREQRNFGKRIEKEGRTIYEESITTGRKTVDRRGQTRT